MFMEINVGISAKNFSLKCVRRTSRIGLGRKSMTYQFDILSCAPPNVVLRDVQVKALLWIQENWHKIKVFVLNMPVGAGKSIVAMTVCEWTKRNGLGQSATITPTKLLQDQYNKDFDWIAMLKGMDNYTCMATPAGNCRSTKRIFKKCCDGGTCPYLIVRGRCITEPVSLYNFHSYYFNKMWKGTVIIDEGHNAANFLFDMYSVKLWQPEWKFDKDVEPTIENVLEIVNAALGNLGEAYAQALAKRIESLIDELENEIRRYTNVKDCLTNWGKDVLIVKKEEEYKGKVKEARNTKQILIQVKPLKVSALAEEVLWPIDATQKIILMSATISMNDVEELGLSQHPVSYFESESPIPKERRPFVVIPVANMKWNAQEESTPIIAKYLEQLAARHPNEKGIVHCTYAVAQKLQKMVGHNPRFWFHDNKNKTEVYQRFRTTPGNSILVASGMSEGIDLPDDAARWQVVTKVMYPSLADDVNQWRCYNAPKLYQWDTVRTIIQQSGRICRNPKDYGITYMLDEEFKRLWAMTKNKGMWPKWFVESMIWVQESGSV